MSETSKTTPTPTPTPKAPSTPADILESDDAQQNPADSSFALKILIELKERFGSIDERTSNLRGDVAGLRDDIKDLRDGLDSKVSSRAFWAGVTILIAVGTLGVGIVTWLMPNPFG